MSCFWLLYTSLDQSLVLILLQARAKANVFAGGATPLHIAADIGDFELIIILLKAGADPDQKDEVNIYLS